MPPRRADSLRTCPATGSAMWSQYEGSRRRLAARRIRSSIKHVGIASGMRPFPATWRQDDVRGIEHATMQEIDVTQYFATSD